jgi:hypothetical protein
MILILTQCDINNQKLLIINHSSKPFYYLLLTDTTLSKDSQLFMINPNDSAFPNFVFGGNGAWKYKINSDSKDSTLHIFILNLGYLNDSIIKNRKYKRLNFQVKDLNSLNWRLNIRD